MHDDNLHRRNRLIFISPGWGKFDVGWYFFKKYFIRQGFDVVYVEYPMSGFCKIEESAALVEEKLEALRPHYEHICFVGHSMGGLVGRYIAQQRQGRGAAPAFDSYVSIGSPHHGTIYGFLGFWSDSASQMRPNSEFIKELNAQQWPMEIPVLTIEAGLDVIVIYPRHSSSMQIPTEDHIVIPYATHSSVIVAPRSIKEIWSWLIYGIFDEVGFNTRTGLFSKIKQKIRSNQ